MQLVDICVSKTWSCGFESRGRHRSDSSDQGEGGNAGSNPVHFDASRCGRLAVRTPPLFQDVYARRLTAGPAADYRKMGVRIPPGVLGSEGRGLTIPVSPRWRRQIYLRREAGAPSFPTMKSHTSEAPMVRASASKTDCCGFESLLACTRRVIYRPTAVPEETMSSRSHSSAVERRPYKATVGGSIPSETTEIFI